MSAVQNLSGVRGATPCVNGPRHSDRFVSSLTSSPSARATRLPPPRLPDPDPLEPIPLGKLLNLTPLPQSGYAIEPNLLGGYGPF